MSGSSVGGICYPVMLKRLFDRIGFGWSVRVAAFLMLGCLIVANFLIHSRLPPPGRTNGRRLLDPEAFKDPSFCLVCVLSFFPYMFEVIEWNLFGNLGYVYASCIHDFVRPLLRFFKRPGVLPHLNSQCRFSVWENPYWDNGRSSGCFQRHNHLHYALRDFFPGNVDRSYESCGNYVSDHTDWFLQWWIH